MTYEETVEYLYSCLPMFHRVGAQAYKASLDNTWKLMEVLKNPERKFRSVHIAGTNGKGSTSNMIAAILQSAGYKTGLYTSPHLIDFRERIRINGQMIPKENVIDFVEKHKGTVSDIQPSFFEWTVGLAYDYFRRENVDIAVIETGLGGRLDSTNVVIPELSVITNISYDHMQQLGETLEKIAGEKAGIIKEKVPVVVGERQEETTGIFVRAAAKAGSSLLFASDHIEVRQVSENVFDVFKHGRLHYKNLVAGLTGSYQMKNIATVLMSIEELTRIGYLIYEDHIRKGIAEVTSITGLQGRWQKINDHPLAICDVGHNEAGIQLIVKQLEQIPFHHLHFVFGVVKDKDVSKIISLLPRNATYYVCKADLPRAMEAEELAILLHSNGLACKVIPEVRNAYNTALKSAVANDLVFVGGSTFVVAEVLRMLN